MARVNVETRALAEQRFYNLMEDMDMNRATAIGHLLIFWHDSQERMVWQGTKREVMKFIPLKGEEKEKFFTSLVDNDYVTEEEGFFEIRGNKRHIDARNKQIELGRMGGLKSGKARAGKAKTKGFEGSAKGIEGPPPKNEGAFKSVKKQGSEKGLEKRRPPYQDPPPEGISKGIEACASKIEPNTMQYNTSNINKKISTSLVVPSHKEKTIELVDCAASAARTDLPAWELAEMASDPPPKQRPRSGREEWSVVAAYEECYKRRYGSKVDLTGKARGQLNNFTKDHGVRRAKELIDAYFRMDFYVDKGNHPVGLLVMDINSISHFLQTGEVLKNQRRKSFIEEKTERTKDFVQRIRRGEL